MATTKKQDIQPVVAKNAPTVALPVAVEEAKPAHKSVTIVLNTLVTIGSLLAFIDPEMVRTFVNAHVGDQDAAVALSALGIAFIGAVNVLIRIYRTKQPIQ